MTDMVRKLATIIQEAARIRENSWVTEKDFYQSRYIKDMGEAAKEAATAAGEPDLWYPVMLALESDWNDILTWAENPGNLDIDVDPDEDKDHEVECGPKLIGV